MKKSITGASAGSVVDGLRREAVGRHGIPEHTARRAADATSRWLVRAEPPDTCAGRKRVAAYFWAVLRRKALSGEAGLADYRAHCVADALAADMMAAGHDAERVVAELSGMVGLARAREAVAAVAA